MGLFLRLTAG